MVTPQHTHTLLTTISRETDTKESTHKHETHRASMELQAHILRDRGEGKEAVVAVERVCEKCCPHRDTQAHTRAQAQRTPHNRYSALGKIAIRKRERENSVAKQ